MGAVTGYRRLPILAIAALLAAGCGANAPSPTSPPASQSAVATATPRPTPPPAPTPSATAAPSFPTFAPIETPAAGCSSLDQVDLTNFEIDLSSVYPSGSGGLGGFSIGHVDAQLALTRITELSGERRSTVAPPVTLSNGRGQMLGGREFVTFPSFDRFGETQTIVEASVTLTLDGGTPIDLPVRIVPGNPILNQAAVSVPDLAGPGSVNLNMSWTDDCFRYDATGTIPVDVVPLRETAGCELDEQLYWDELEALLDDSIVAGGTKPNVGSAFNESRFAPYLNPGIDAFIGYMFDPDAPELVVPVGGTVQIENGKPRRLDLGERMKVIIWTRRSVAQAVKDYPPHGLVEVVQGRLQQQPDGSYALPVPTEPGHYVAALSVQFESKCSTGTLWSVVNLATV